MRAAEQMIEQIVASSGVPSRRRRLEIARELRSHVQDFVSAAHSEGRSDDEIEKMVLANWGDPLEVANNFAWVYRHERAVRGFSIFAFSTLAVAALSAAGTLVAQAGVAAAGFGIPLLDTLASRHTIIEVSDIVSTVAAYLGLISLEKLFDTRPLLKAVAVLFLILALAVGSAAAAQERVPFLIFGFVNALFLRAVQIFLRAPAARFGAVILAFGLTGAFFWTRLSGFHRPLSATLASWMVMGLGYQLMTGLAVRFNRELFDRYR